VLTRRLGRLTALQRALILEAIIELIEAEDDQGPPEILPQ
jgi:hypothetical protein